MKRKNKKDAGYMDGTPNITMKTLLFFILLAGSFGIFNTASAGTFDILNSNGETVRFIVDINKTSFLPTPESISVTGQAYSYASTSNIISLSATTNGATVSLFNSVTISPSSWSSFYDNSLTGLSAPGSSSVVFSASVYADPIPPPPPPMGPAYLYITCSPGELYCSAEINGSMWSGTIERTSWGDTVEVPGNFSYRVMSAYMDNCPNGYNVYPSVGNDTYLPIGETLTVEVSCY